MIPNAKVRRQARAENVPLWKVAQEIGISEPTLTRWLRVPLSSDRETRILKAIQALADDLEEETHATETD